MIMQINLICLETFSKLSIMRINLIYVEKFIS
jgi:hypothetical protein